MSKAAALLAMLSVYGLSSLKSPGLVSGPGLPLGTQTLPGKQTGLMLSHTGRTHLQCQWSTDRGRMIDTETTATLTDNIPTTECLPIGKLAMQVLAMLLH